MKPTKNHIMCPYAEKPKILFGSKSKALRFIAWNAEEITASHGYCPTRAYYCSGCGGWHVTSKEKYRSSRRELSNSIFEPDPLCRITAGIASMQQMLYNGEYAPCYAALQKTTGIYLNLPEKVRNDKQGKESKRMLLSIAERLSMEMATGAA